jgi:hypothetical protein
MLRTAAVAIVALAAGAAAAVCVSERWRHAVDSAVPEWTRLPNGLRFRAQRVRGAKNVAVVTVYGIGSDSDPLGQAGLAHLAEHLYVTSAAGAEPARTVEDWLEHYRKQCDATTHGTFTCMAGVVEPEGLEQELADVAARMSDLRIDAASLDYERPRVLEQIEEPHETGSRWTSPPWSPAARLARTRIHPVPNAGHAGGLAADVNRFTLDELRAFARRVYCPANARIAVAGDVDPEAVAALVERLFAALPAGEPAPDPPRVEPLVGNVRIDRGEAPGPGYETCRGVCIAYARNRDAEAIAASAHAFGFWRPAGDEHRHGFIVLPRENWIEVMWKGDDRPIEEVIAEFDAVVLEFALNATGPAAAAGMQQARRQLREAMAVFRKTGVPAPWSDEEPSWSLAAAFHLATPRAEPKDFESALAAVERLTNQDMRRFVESWHVAERRVVVDVRGWQPPPEPDPDAETKADDQTPARVPGTSLIREFRIAMSWDEATQSMHRKIGDREYPKDDDLQKAVAEAHDAWVKNRKPDTPVTIDADPRISWNDVITVVNIVKRCGIEKIEFAMGAPPKAKPPR